MAGFARTCRLDLGTEVGSSFWRRCREDAAVSIEERDLRIDDVRDARRDLLRVSPAAFGSPFDGAVRLLFESIVELPHEVLGEPAIEHVDRQDADDYDQRDMA